MYKMELNLYLIQESIEIFLKVKCFLGRIIILTSQRVVERDIIF